ncbi:MAG: hypothetical protein E6J41_04680 [Chloroflexi bacterium]|nr:MAG: hypothetical protein E6J41_04680 [Chloroflexota bacterium]
MKVLRLLTVPAVLLFGLVLAVPASAHQLTNVTVTVACQTSSGKVCVTLTGDIPASDNDARNVFFDLFATGSNTSLGEIEFNLPASNGSVQHFSQTLCFPAVAGNTTGFTVKVVKVTDSQGSPSDLAITIGDQTINFTADHQPKTTVGETGQCAQATPTPTPTPKATPTPTATATPTSGGSGGGSPTPTASANTTVALAQTGGFDFRYPLIGLILLVAGGALFVVSASRGRSAQTK